LNLSPRESYELQHSYFLEYGLSLQGLVKHHQVDALDFNEKVDNAIPLEEVLTRSPSLRKLLEDVDTSKVKLWLLTNAYITHGQRVVRILGVDDLFEGITYCDYAAEELVAKPNPGMFNKAMKDAGVQSVQDCYFVGRFITTQCLAKADLAADDSQNNAKGATEFGWTAVHLVEPSEEPPKDPASKYMIRSLEELRDIFPDFFLTS
jgi:pyrimidine and pyridine-specific 5'-nucleotidase